MSAGHAEPRSAAERSRALKCSRAQTRNAGRLLLCAAIAPLFAFGCGATSDRDEPVAVAVAALSVCSETVPGNRNIDGIPSYAQCADSMNSPIFSNNGVDTATAQMGSDWIRTQWSGGYQCTEFAHRYLYFKWQVNWVPNGDAGTWCDATPPASSGLVQATAAVHGDLMVLAPGSCGASTTAGHVAVVDSVDAASGKLTVVEQNGARRGTYQASCPKCFLHVVANNGTPVPIATPPGTAGAGGAAGAGQPATGAAGSATVPPPPTTPPPVTPTTPATTPPPATPTGAMPPATTPPSAAQPAMPAATPPPSTPSVVQPGGSAGAAASSQFAAAEQARTDSAQKCSAARVRGSRASTFAWLAPTALALLLVRSRRRAHRIA